MYFGVNLHKPTVRITSRLSPRGISCLVQCGRHWQALPLTQRLHAFLGPFMNQGANIEHNIDLQAHMHLCGITHLVITSCQIKHIHTNYVFAVALLHMISDSGFVIGGQIKHLDTSHVFAIALLHCVRMNEQLTWRLPCTTQCCFDNGAHLLSYWIHIGRPEDQGCVTYEVMQLC